MTSILNRTIVSFIAFMMMLSVISVPTSHAGDALQKFSDQLSTSETQFRDFKSRMNEKRTELPKFTYLKPIKAEELDRYFGYQSDGFMSGVEWKISQDTPNSTTPVTAPLAGTIVKIHKTTALGTSIQIHHAQGIETFLAHLDTTTVDEGDIVSPGSIIGTLNSKAFNTIYHEVRIENVPVDPAEAVGLDFFDLKDALFEDASKALKKEARIEKIIIKNDDAKMSYAQSSGPTTNGAILEARGLKQEDPERPDPEPGCNEVVYNAISDNMDNRANRIEQEVYDIYSDRQSIMDTLCVEQLLDNVLNLGNTYVGTNPGASQRQLQRAIRQVKDIANSHVEKNYLGAGSAMLVGLRNAAQAALDNMVNAINNFVLGSISAITGGLFGAIFGLGEQYNCQGIAALWYTAEECFGLDIGGFLDGITLDRIELPNFGCVIESLASSYDPRFYRNVGGIDGEYIPYGQYYQNTRANPFSLYD